MSDALPGDIRPESMSRLPLRSRESMDERGRRLYDVLVGPQSRTLVGVRGPGGILLHSPELGERLRAVNQFLRFETGLDRQLTELAILVTARELDNQFEWTAHEPAALAEGLSQEIIDVVKYRRSADGLGPMEALIVSFGREVFRERKVRSETFARAVQAFGYEGVVNLAALMGNYAMTAVLLDAVDQHVHPERRPLLPLP
jgi:4-carboxymuconolactone decarboxylase